MIIMKCIKENNI